MRQRGPIPNVDAGNGLSVQRVTCGRDALIGTCDGHDQIQLRARIDNPSDAAKNSIYFPKSPKTVDINRRQACRLQDKFFVVHKHPRNKLVSSQGLVCVRNLTHGKENRALASSQIFAPDKCSKLNTLHVCMHSGASA
jgi:hypothetical protein